MTDKLLELAKVLPQWLAALAAVLYATGFLTVFMFMEHLGLRETGVEFSQVKYIHVGILFLLLPLGVILPLTILFAYRKRINTLPDSQFSSMNAGEKRVPINGAMVALMINLLWIFYVLICFAPPQHLMDDNREWVIAVIFLVTFFCAYLINKFEQKFLKEEHATSFSDKARWGIVIVVLLLDAVAFGDLLPQLGRVFWGENKSPTGAAWYVVFWLCIIFVASRTVYRMRQIQDAQARTMLCCMSGCIIFCLYFISVLAFARSVYPYIPVAKGGGDYSSAKPVAIQYVNSNYMPPAYLTIHTNWWTNNMNQQAEQRITYASNSIVIVEETPDIVFLVDTNDAGGPRAWRTWRKVPKLIEIRRQNIQAIVYDNGK